MDALQKTRVTYFYERWRAITAGILETAGSTFLLLIAVRWFEAGSTAKALVAGGGSFGLLLSPWVVEGVILTGWTAAQASALLSLGGALTFLFMAMVPTLPVFVVGSIVAMAAAAAAIPLMTQIYQENYPQSMRGSLFSKTIMIRIAAAAAFSEVAGRILSRHLDRFQWLLVFFAAAFLVASLCLFRCPSRSICVPGGAHPFRTWRCVRDDRLFRRTLVCWMLMGFANLMMFPMRVEYLANPKYGLALSVAMIAWCVGVIPNLARLTLSPIWGWLFDRMNFFTLRVALNLGFALGILTFFTSQTMTGLIWGAIVFGIASAGGDVAWNLWVTKFAPPDRVADYMAVHTFFTGLRGVAAPLVAFYLVGTMRMITLGWISTALILAASLILIPEMKFGRSPRSPNPVVEEA